MAATTHGAAALAAIVLAISLSACTTSPEVQLGPDSPAPQPSNSGSPADTKFLPDGDATDNKAHFDAIASAVSAQNRTPRGRKFIDALVASGFDKAAMEVTFDKTAVDLFADNVQFSVLISGACIIGQDGNVGYQSTVLPMLTTGTCLIGKTRPIDW
ncbi:MAG: DUF6993 domain-containing protein [Microbacteriaceae bacterium]